MTREEMFELKLHELYNDGSINLFWELVDSYSKINHNKDIYDISEIVFRDIANKHKMKS